MRLTSSWAQILPPGLLRRYRWVETRWATHLLQATAPDQLADLCAVLEGFRVTPEDLTTPGGNESKAARRLNDALRQRGWYEGHYTVQSTWTVHPVRGEHPTVSETASSPTHRIDNLKPPVAVDVEWHAKDGNLDRDLAAYRILYEGGIITVGVVITVVRTELRALALALDPASTRFATTTTTCLEQLQPRLERGDAGGCPVLVAAAGRDNYQPDRTAPGAPPGTHTDG